MSLTSENLMRPILTAAILAGASSYMWGIANINMLGVSVPTYVPLMIAGAAGAAGSEIFHDYILPESKGNKPFENLETFAVGALGVSVLSVGFLKLTTDLPLRSFPGVAGLSTASFALSEFAVDNLLKEPLGSANLLF